MSDLLVELLIPVNIKVEIKDTEARVVTKQANIEVVQTIKN
jgi:hypothetical protein